MTVLPVVERELRVRSRKGWTYWSRFGAASAVVTFAMLFWFNFSPSTPAHERGMQLFVGIGIAGALYSLLAGVESTADCVSEEKRDGTLGLMFLTDLRGYDVILGKLAASSIGAVYVLFSVVPILAIPLLLGGITSGEVARVVLVWFNTLFLSLSAGVLVSTLGRNEQQCRGRVATILISLAGLLPLMGLLVRETKQRIQIDPWWLLPSPGYTLALSFDGLFATRADQFWLSNLILCGLGGVFLLTSMLAAPRCWQEKPRGTFRERWAQRWKQWTLGSGPSRAAYRRRLLEINPIYWLAARERLKPSLALGFLGIIAAGSLWLFFKDRRALQDLSFSLSVSLAWLYKCWVALEAPRQFHAEQRSGALELVLSTPLTAREILRGQLLALNRQFFWPVLLVIFANLALMFWDVKLHGSRNIPFWIGGILLLALDMVAIAWVGMWQGLISRNAFRAAGWTFLRIMILPLAIMTVALMTGAFGGARGEIMAVLVYFCIRLLNNWFHFFWARSNLLERFNPNQSGPAPLLHTNRSPAQRALTVEG